MTPPNYLDGAKVITWAWSGEEPFGYIPVTEGEDKEAVFGLAICTYENAKQFYRFSCDKNWEVIQDASYNSVDDAIQFLPEQYKNAERNWQEIK